MVVRQKFQALLGLCCSNVGNDNRAICASSSASPCSLLSLITFCNNNFSYPDLMSPPPPPNQCDLKLSSFERILVALKSGLPSGDVVWSPLVSMLSANLFRPLPPPARKVRGVKTNLAPAGPCLRVVYDILMYVVANADERTLCRHINRAFISNLIPLFQSEILLERQRLTDIYLLLHAKLDYDTASFMRRLTSGALLQAAFETRRAAGVPELLKIWAMFIEKSPKLAEEERRAVLTKVLLPLHKAKRVGAYHKELSHCMKLSVQKEPELGEVAVKGVLRHWPVASWRREVLMIGELESLVEILHPCQLEKKALVVSICSRIAKSSYSSNSKIAESALTTWKSDQFVRMASRHWEAVLPCMVESIENKLKWHWNSSILGLRQELKMKLLNAERKLYMHCLLQLKSRRRAVGAEEQMKRREIRWERLEEAAAHTDRRLHILRELDQLFKY